MCTVLDRHLEVGRDFLHLEIQELSILFKNFYVSVTYTLRYCDKWLVVLRQRLLAPGLPGTPCSSLASASPKQGL